MIADGLRIIGFRHLMPMGPFSLMSASFDASFSMIPIFWPAAGAIVDDDFRWKIIWGCRKVPLMIIRLMPGAAFADYAIFFDDAADFRALDAAGEPWL